MKKDRIDLKSLSREAVETFMIGMGLPKYRSGQIVHWIYDKLVTDIDGITEFSKDLRTVLGQSAYVSNLKLIRRLISSDDTEKFLFSLEDGYTVESVLIPDEERLTLCVSSQVGCALGCLFCRTGMSGFTRNLKAHEIVDQIISVNRLIRKDRPAGTQAEVSYEGGLSGRRITNIVLMGMGEPLMNFDNVVEALLRLEDLMGISKRRITLSTSGIVPKLPLLFTKAPGVNLAVSLNAASNEVRDRLMPVNKKYPISALLNACRKYPLRPGRKLTFEYVLIDGLNDSPDDARKLVHLLKGIKCRVNLIPFNPHEGSKLRRPSDQKV
ncbi:MAG TPA: 23S rRNA (adenine(2503)-C(2))-methyltransferase RlmN, partial [Thermodesulfovibrionales bacterium]|nr:23S rRNA (adenine(2503)-C(2))-methyltransferase RlmN [Thermodesulfovibrionales bacterium]